MFTKKLIRGVVLQHNVIVNSFQLLENGARASVDVGSIQTLEV
jgi:hypothetical protein